MKYPMLYSKDSSRQVVDAFKGYNHNLRIGDGEFFDMKNMTSDYYPVLAPRKKRGIYKNGVSATGLIAKNFLCYVDGSDFVYGSDRIEMGLTKAPKELVSMGAYVIILPDRKYINTIKNDNGEYEFGNIDEEYTTIKPVSFSLCTITGDAYYEEGKEPPKHDMAPESPENGDLWIDTSSTPHTLKKFSKDQDMWVSIATTYIKIYSVGLSERFKQYDGIKLSGITVEGLTDLNAAHVVWESGKDYIVIKGILDKVAIQEPDQGKITFSRKMPNMDIVVEANNRLWGCRYGTDENGAVVNEIYASKLGDFKNWNCFMGVSTDSWVGQCGTDGLFTGAITHRGYPLFFKENCVHKVYGDYPANFRFQNTECRGVQQGCGQSLAIVNETVFYKSRNAVCAYDGSLPVEISSALGDIQYDYATGCAFGNKYYINMRDAEGICHLFVYDTEKGVWHKEDGIEELWQLCTFRGDLYGIDYETGNIITMLGSGSQYEYNVPWMIETGLIGMSMPDMKYISKMMIRMSLETDASVDVSIQYDSMENWEHVCNISATSLRTFSVPIRLRRCDHFRIRIEGNGDGRIYSITKTIEQGSDVS